MVASINREGHKVRLTMKVSDMVSIKDDAIPAVVAAVQGILSMNYEWTHRLVLDMSSCRLVLDMSSIYMSEMMLMLIRCYSC